MASIPLPFDGAWHAFPINNTVPGQSQVFNPDAVHPIYVRVLRSGVVGPDMWFGKVNIGQTLTVPFNAGDTVQAICLAAVTVTVT